MQQVIDDMNQVFTLLQQHKWERALKEARKSPKLVRNLYQVSGFYDGQIHSKVNALHMASALGAPAEVIQGLAAIHPNGPMQADTKYGRVPLQVAVMAGAPASTISALLKADPRAAQREDFNKRLALHYACKDQADGETVIRLLLKVYPEGAQAADDLGFLPLHVACRYSPSPMSIRMLIRAAPASIMCKTYKGSTPIMCARTNKAGCGKDIEGILERSAEETCSRTSDSSSSQDSRRRRFEKYDSTRVGFTTTLRRVQAA